MLQDSQGKRFTFLYFILPLSSGIVNLVAKVYSVWLNKRLLASAVLVSHDQEDPHLSEDKFLLSLTSVLVLPLIFMTGFLSSLSEREVRVKFLLPTQLMLLSIVLPLLLIVINPKLKDHILQKYFEPSKNKLNTLLKNVKRMFSEKVYPINMWIKKTQIIKLKTFLTHYQIWIILKGLFFNSYSTVYVQFDYFIAS